MMGSDLLPEKFVPIARQYLREAAVCMTCSKPPKILDMRVDTMGERLTVVYGCHGAVAGASYDWRGRNADDFSETLRRWDASLRVFLRSVAMHGTVSAAARRERRERLRR